MESVIDSVKGVSWQKIKHWETANTWQVILGLKCEMFFVLDTSKFKEKGSFLTTCSFRIKSILKPFLMHTDYLCYETQLSH